MLGSQAVFMSRHSVRLETDGKELREKPAIGFVSLKGQLNLFVPSGLSTSLVSPLLYHFWSLKHVWLIIIQLKSSHNPEW